MSEAQLMRTIRAYYADPEYVRAAEQHALGSRPKRLPVLAQYVDREGLSVELGCGVGVFSDISRRYVGLDISLPALRALRARGGQAVCCDLAHMPLRDGVADTVISFDTLEHVYRPDRVIAEVDRLLARGGRAILKDVWLKTEKRSGWLPRKLRKRLGNVASRFQRLWRELRGDFEVAWWRITPDYTRIGSDYDAVSRIDAHSVFRYFRARGYAALNEHPRPLPRILRLWTRHRHWVLVEKR